MKRKTRESTIVIIEPTHIGMPNKMLSAIEDPITS
jgi:hypothetical protein